jgi:thiosulfate dehydrogenase
LSLELEAHDLQAHDLEAHYLELHYNDREADEMKYAIRAGIVAAAFGLAGWAEAQEAAPAERTGEQPERNANAGALEVELSGGENASETPADEQPAGETGQARADALLSQWKSAHPDAEWVDEETEKHEVMRPADNSGLVAKGQGGTYSDITAADVAIWERETYKLAVEGSRIFHSADELGSEVAVSCDMCHPNAANTHPETYPKFQVQLGRVALLRDMINWCIEQPVRGPQLEPDGHKMRALEAYILAQRKGVALDYGKR